MVYCRSPFAANTVYALLGPQSPHQCPWCRPTQGLHGQMDSDVSHVQGHHSTGLRGRTLGVSASAGNKAEIYRCVWGSLGGGWGWHSGLDRHMLWCVPMRLQTCGIICSPLPTEVLQTCAISKAYWCWCILVLISPSWTNKILRSVYCFSLLFRHYLIRAKLLPHALHSARTFSLIPSTPL